MVKRQVRLYLALSYIQVRSSPRGRSRARLATNGLTAERQWSVQNLDLHLVWNGLRSLTGLDLLHKNGLIAAGCNG